MVLPMVDRTRSLVSFLLATFALGCLSACTEVHIDDYTHGCAFDSECALDEVCNAYGRCVALETGRVQAPAPEPSATSEPETQAQTPMPTPEPVVEPESASLEPDAGPTAECTDDATCGSGRICLDERCVVGCEGVPAAGSCTPFVLSYCANVGLPTEAVRTASLADPVCLGEILVDSCSAAGTPVVTDCTSLGGDCSLGACISIAEGQPCDDEVLRCGNDDTGRPMQCAGRDGSGLGVCERGCGDVTGQGECDGDTLRYCANEGTAGETIETFNCGQESLKCGEMRPDTFGCVGAVGLGATCWDAQQNNGEVSYCGGDDGTLACELDVYWGEGTCVRSNEICDAPVGAAPTCSGNRLMLFCSVAQQPVLLNCTDYGANCSDSANACVGVDRGEPCDANLRCATGMFCGPQGICDF